MIGIFIVTPVPQMVLSLQSFFWKEPLSVASRIWQLPTMTTVLGFFHAQPTAKKLGINLIPAIELTCQWRGAVKFILWD